MLIQITRLCIQRLRFLTCTNDLHDLHKSVQETQPSGRLHKMLRLVSHVSHLFIFSSKLFITFSSQLHENLDWSNLNPEK